MAPFFTGLAKNLGGYGFGRNSNRPIFTSPILTTSVSGGNQRENDYRSSQIYSNMIGYLSLNLSWSWNWSGDLGGTLNQYIGLRKSNGNTVSQSTGSGSSGSGTLIIPVLDPNENHNLFWQATSTGPGYLVRNATASFSWTYTYYGN